MSVFIVVDINLVVSEEFSIPAVFDSLQKAFDYAIEDVKKVNGKSILVHGNSIEGYSSSTNRISNNMNMGSDFGITYKSNYGNYPCARMIVARKMN